mgnify:CR=1 FL=1
MDKWNPFPNKEFLLELYLAEQDLTDEILIFWNKIRISPETWTCEDVIHENFWVVAKHQNWIIWYNDVEEGYNLSRYKEELIILEYGASQDELVFAVKKLNTIIQSI